MNRSLSLVVDFLRSEQERGVTHVPLDDEARAILRAMFQRGKGGPAQGQGLARPGATAPAVREEPVAPLPEESPAGPWLPEIRGSTPAEKIASLAAQAEHWEPARRLGTLRAPMVFSTGDPEAELMLVGEAPGYQEELQREPFVGPAGQKLDDILRAMGLSRRQVYISNVVKFRPAMPNQTNNNRKPSPEEIAACLPFLRAEVAVVQPKCIVALGGTAAEGLLGLSGTVAGMRGAWHTFESIPARVTYHPSYLIRSDSDFRKKRDVWEDMMEVMEKLGLPVSAKQRGFFLPKK